MANPTFANVTPLPQKDGRTYCLNQPVPAAEGDLFAVPPPGPPAANPLPDPLPVLYGQAAFAVVVLTAVGPVTTNTTYVVLQQDNGDGNWIDVAWITWTGTTGNATFYLAAGAFSANAGQQSRAVGTAPSPANSSVQLPLGGRLRFVGKSSINVGSSSSSSSGSLAPQVQATITVKILGLS